MPDRILPLYVQMRLHDFQLALWKDRGGFQVGIMTQDFVCKPFQDGWYRNLDTALDRFEAEKRRRTPIDRTTP